MEQKMRQKELLQFRTPQHPSLGSNHWGGASPLLARNIPRESLDQRYLRLNAVRDRDQVFPSTTIEEEIFGSPPTTATIGDEIFSSSRDEAPNYKYKLNRRRRIWKLVWRPKKLKAKLGSSSSSKWLPNWNSKKRWPNGWC